MIIQMLRNLFLDSTEKRQEGREVAAVDYESGSGNEIEVITHTTDKRYESDIENLRNYIGEDKFVPGLIIDVSLKELLSVAPRKRERSDAYVGLVNYLKEEMCIELKIKTKKRKGNEKSINFNKQKL